MVTDIRILKALSEFTALKDQLGLKGVPSDAEMIWQKKETDRNHIVLKIECDGQTFAMKRDFSTKSELRLQDWYLAQSDAHAALSGFPRLHAPEIFHMSDDGRIVVMAFHEGKTLDQRLYDGQDPKPLLRRCGRWLTKFHKRIDRSNRTYRPEFMVHHIAHRIQAIENQDVKVAEPDLFLSCARKIPDIARRFEGQRTVSARKHGDLNLRNLILSEDGICGIDFKPAQTAPVGFDIARLLMDYAEIHQKNSALAPSELLLPETLDAFFAGYQLVDKEDPSVGFLPFVQLLTDWQSIPPSPLKRSWRQKDRFEQILTLAKSGFS